MKISGVSATRPVPEQDSDSHHHPGREFAFRIEPLLEISGDSSADAEQDESPEAQGWCRMVAEGFAAQDEDEGNADDSLESFLERMRRAHRLDLRI